MYERHHAGEVDVGLCEEGLKIHLLGLREVMGPLHSRIEKNAVNIRIYLRNSGTNISVAFQTGIRVQ